MNRPTEVEAQKLEAMVSMAFGVFKPYAGISTAIVRFTTTNSGVTDNVCFGYSQAYDYSLDDQRTPQPEKSDLADILACWRNREVEPERAWTDQSLLVPKNQIAENDYDLSTKGYTEVEYKSIECDPSLVILERLAKLEAEESDSRNELERLLR